jgi:hypothetical protein
MRRNITNTGTFKAGFSIRLQHLHFPKKVVGIGIVVRLKMPPYAKKYVQLSHFYVIIYYFKLFQLSKLFFKLKLQMLDKEFLMMFSLLFFKLKSILANYHLDPDQDSYTGIGSDPDPATLVNLDSSRYPVDPQPFF